MRIEVHCHTRYSYDSILSLNLLYIACLIKKIKYIAITDHNTIEGAIAFKRICDKRGSKVNVIVGEEIMTLNGEIIALFIKNKIPSNLSPEETVSKIEEQRGLVYIPHPYDLKRKKTVLDERSIADLSKRIDCMEAHNGRNILREYDDRQMEIVKKYNVNKVIGSDAHSVIEIGRNYMDVQHKPETPEDFIAAIVSARFYSKKCLFYIHTYTRIIKIVRLIMEGKISEVFRIINERFSERMSRMGSRD